MAVLHEEDFVPDAVECANCGGTDDLLKCSRCHSAWFCGVKCQKAYWPFHRTQCRRNEFADAIEEAEPKFAGWMRRHGKLAVLKDAEVDRLERAAAAASGPSREEVMDSMYGRAEPKPIEPRYSADERARMRRAEEEAAAGTRRALASGAYYASLEVPPRLGLACGGYKWRQDQCHVEVYVQLPEGTQARKVLVELTPSRLHVEADGRPLLSGALYHEIKRDESAWYIQEGVLELVLLKRCRRGHYEDGKTNADTFWKSLLRGAPASDTLQLEHPPTEYYSTYWEGKEKERPAAAAARARRTRRPLAAAEAGEQATVPPLLLAAH